jgi:hypothetical protein
MPQLRNLLQLEGSQRRHRAMAQALQHDQTALVPKLPAARTADISPGHPRSGSDRSNAVVSSPLVQNIRQVSFRIARAQSPIGFRRHAQFPLMLIFIVAQYGGDSSKISLYSQIALWFSALEMRFSRLGCRPPCCCFSTHAPIRQLLAAQRLTDAVVPDKNTSTVETKLNRAGQL